MLSELHVRQFALIEDVQLDLASGMTVFSGETGAGKSMLVDALGAAFGARASSDWVRHGADKAEVIAMLEGMNDALQRLLNDNDLEADDASLILRRVIRADGSSRAWVNGSPVAARLLQDIGHLLLDMHGQHEHQSLMRPEFQCQLLDARIAERLQKNTAVAWALWKKENAALQLLLDDRDRGVREEAWMREEYKRLADLDLHVGLQAELQQKIEAGRHFSHIQQAVTHTLGILEDDDSNDSDNGNDLRGKIAACSRELGAVAAFHPQINEATDLLAQVDALLGEISPALRSVLDTSFDSESLEADETRLMNMHEAMRRNKTDADGLIALLGDLQEKISHLDTGLWDEEAQRAKLKQAADDFRAQAQKLSQARHKAGLALVGDLRPFLDQLALAGMQLRIDIMPQTDDENAWNAHGFDAPVFMAASNPGEPFRELAAVASGGEMSRLVLALKGCGAMAGAPQIAIFDEVDAGIGGETAWCVGELLAQMGRMRQVLVISHLPQVAACAGRQIHIYKEQHDGRTVSGLKPLDAESRLDEMARMLGGASEQSREHAAQMLARGAACTASN
ncbi:MAG: DNA repair protein RecN [Mariprofundaceae bacterium]|nr:DNA repair protein RecN [Mariprofundaceae bacterium]